MLTSDPIVAGAEALVAIKAYLRIEHDEDDATLVALATAALARCEGFTGAVPIARGFVETIDAGRGWTGLHGWPVVAVTLVERVDAGVLNVGDYAVDIGVDGVGRVRLTTTAPVRLRIGYRAGTAADWAAIAEPLRQGVVRLVAQGYAARDGSSDAGLPAAVIDLWRGSRRLRLA